MITEVAFMELIKFLTSVRMVLAVALCASLNPWCTCALLGAPGNSEVSSEALLMFRSVRTDSLGNQQQSVPDFRLAVGVSQEDLQLGRIGSLV